MYVLPASSATCTISMSQRAKRESLAHYGHGSLRGGGQRVGSSGNSGETQKNCDCLDHFRCIPFYPFVSCSEARLYYSFFTIRQA